MEFVALLTFLLYTTQIIQASIDISSFLIKKVESDPTLNQIMWIINNSYHLPIQFPSVPIDHKTAFPSVIIDKKIANVNLAQELSTLSGFKNSRSTLIVTFSINIQANDLALMDFLTHLVQVEQRPKLLIIEKVPVAKNYRKVLKSLWNRNFLDVTVLELIPQKSKNEKFILNLNVESVTQHFYNPFMGEFTKRKISFERELFPDKLINLQGYKLKIGYFHYPPYFTISRNKSGHVGKLDGPDYQLVGILSDAMNFEVLEIISNKTIWDVNSCIKEENTGFTRALMFNEINFVAVQTGRLIVPCLKNLIKYIDLSFGKIYYSAVAPTLSGDDVRLSIEFKVSYLISITFLLTILWLSSNLMQFELRNWQMIDMFRMMLGMSVPRVPRQLKERLLFICVLTVCFFQSSVIFTAFTSLNLEKESSNLIDSLNDLYSSNFTPTIHKNVLQLFELDNLKVAHYVKRASMVAITDKECIYYLAKYRNITCFMRSTQAEMEIKKIEEEVGGGVMHKVKEPISVLMSSLKCEPAFPYESRFKIIFSRLQQTGIPYRWQEKYLKSTIQGATKAETLNSESDASNLQVYQNIIFILSVGFSCSIVMFIGELLLYYCVKSSRC